MLIRNQPYHSLLHSKANEPVARVPKMTRGKIPLARGFHCCPIFCLFLVPDRLLYIVKNIYIYIYIYTYAHISECVGTVYELKLLTNKTAREIFLHTSVEVRKADWIFIIGPGGDWAST